MKEKKIVIGLLLSAIVLMAVGYAAFATNLTINGTANIESNWKVLFTNIDIVSKSDGVTIKNTATASGTTATFDVGLTSPGDKIEYRITVANQGNIDAVIESINASDAGSDAIIFEITNIKTGDILLKNATTTFNVKISYKDSITSQPDNLINKLTVEIKYVQNVGQSITPSTPNIESGQVATLMSKLQPLITNAKSDANLDFSKTSEEDGTTGLYYTNTNTEDNKTTYYFRGAVDNNYVKFGKAVGCAYKGEPILYLDPTTLIMSGDSTSPTEEQCESTYVCDAGTLIKDSFGFVNYRYVTGVDSATCSYLGGTPLIEKATYGLTDILWRIVRINEDGSIRIITENLIGHSKFNENSVDNAYVGYMYGATNQSGDNAYKLTHSNDNPSTIKDYLDDWYVSNLKTNYSKYLADAGFCNDRSVAITANTWESGDTALGYGTNYTYYGAYNRLNNSKKPQFKCQNANNDLFTTSISSKGNKALTNPIGLITYDEVAYAGGVFAKGNTSYYLNNSNNYLTMSPNGFFSELVYVYDVNADGNVSSTPTYDGSGVRPVASLQSGVEIVSGNGQKDTPYVIKTN